MNLNIFKSENSKSDSNPIRRYECPYGHVLWTCGKKKMLGEKALDVKRDSISHYLTNNPHERAHSCHILSSFNFVLPSDNRFIVIIIFHSLCRYYFVAKLITCLNPETGVHVKAILSLSLEFKLISSFPSSQICLINFFSCIYVINGCQSDWF